jgi:hypothetical protein
MFKEMLKSYFKKIFDVNKTGDAREESYYSTLEDLLNTYAESINKKNVHITTLPKKTETGNPDFRIWDGKQHIIGYIEAKAPTTEYLHQVCDKWLKDRKGRMLSPEDIKHYCKVVTAIKNTIEIQKEIDNLYPDIEKEFIEFKNLKTKQ